MDALLSVWTIAQAVLTLTILILCTGYLWARVFVPSRDVLEILAFTIALSTTFVAATALLLARLLGPQINRPVAIASVTLVSLTSLIAYRWIGPVKPLVPPIDRHESIQLRPLTIISVALALAISLADALELLTSRATPSVTAGLLLIALVFQRFPRHRSGDPAVDERSFMAIRPSTCLREDDTGYLQQRIPRMRAVLLLPLFLLVTVRAYIGVIRHDWPYLRGEDQYAHAVMTNLMISEGSAQSFMVYPPGYHTMTAVLAHLSGLSAIELYTILSPLSMLLPAVAGYVLARRLLGYWPGVAAAFIIGMLLRSPEQSMNEGAQPNIFTAEFLLILAVAALVMLLRSPSQQGIVLTGVIGSSIVLFHTIATLYLVLVLGVFTFFILPYLWFRHRRPAKAAVGALALLGVLALAFAWDTYQVPKTLGVFLGLRESVSTTELASRASGTQLALDLAMYPSYLSPPVVWFGLLGAGVLAMMSRWMPTARATGVWLLLGWTMLFFIGSRIVVLGFPVRLTRELGIPLAICGGFGFLVTVQAHNQHRALTHILRLLAVALVCVYTGQSLARATTPGHGLQLMNPNVEEAVSWLDLHRGDGRIIVSPYYDRTLLALAGLPVMPAMSRVKLASGRGVSPWLKAEARDVLYVYEHPGDSATRAILQKYDVRYVMLLKRFPRTMPNAARIDAVAFREQKHLYEIAFENEHVLILKVRTNSEEARIPAVGDPHSQHTARPLHVAVSIKAGDAILGSV